MDSGWELYVGGNGGMKVRECDFLAKVETEDEVMEYCGAFIQLYREEARYLDRTAPWVERVGLDYVKQRVVEDHERPQGAPRPLQVLAGLLAGRSMGRTRLQGRGRA